ncbi:hypothetical protein D0Y65_048097 [Glycine soja]|uniref:Uncharacterized protein n=1 Tax=Glycine soja TaxID=3848 RepID=A0A445FRK8_GLYSO|nr:hypothetical protein D0Y65_048097 [Glycine soja]
MVAPVEREKLPKREKTKSGGATRNLDQICYSFSLIFSLSLSRVTHWSRFFVAALSEDFAGAEMHAVDVAAAQHGGGGENDVVSDFQKLSSAFTGVL